MVLPTLTEEQRISSEGTLFWRQLELEEKEEDVTLFEEMEKEARKTFETCRGLYYTMSMKAARG